MVELFFRVACLRAQVQSRAFLPKKISLPSTLSEELQALADVSESIFATKVFACDTVIGAGCISRRVVGDLGRGHALYDIHFQKLQCERRSLSSIAKWTVDC